MRGERERNRAGERRRLRGRYVRAVHLPWESWNPGRGGGGRGVLGGVGGDVGGELLADKYHITPSIFSQLLVWLTCLYLFFNITSSGKTSLIILHKIAPLSSFTIIYQSLDMVHPHVYTVSEWGKAKMWRCFALLASRTMAGKCLTECFMHQGRETTSQSEKLHWPEEGLPYVDLPEGSQSPWVSLKRGDDMKVIKYKKIRE